MRRRGGGAQDSQRPMEETLPMAWNAAMDHSMGRPSRKASAVCNRPQIIPNLSKNQAEHFQGLARQCLSSSAALGALGSKLAGQNPQNRGEQTPTVLHEILQINVTRATAGGSQDGEHALGMQKWP